MLINRENRKKLLRLLPFAAYLCVWMILFFLLKQRKVAVYTDPSLPIDLRIPYIRYFVIPYFLWLPWLAFVWIHTAWTDAFLCRHISLTSMIGRTVYLILAFFWPTALSLRPDSMPCSDFFCRLTSMIYRLSDETYVFPSIHVFDSCVALYAVFRGSGFFQPAGFRIPAVILTVLICLSTVLIRQHSVVDAAGGIILFSLCLPAAAACIPMHRSIREEEVP